MNLMSYKFSTVVAKRYWIILVLLIVALGISGISAYGALSPQYETGTESESVTLYEYKAWYEHSAVVAQENPLWPVGLMLCDQSVYFPKVSPNMNGSFNFRITGASSDVSAHYYTKLVLSATVKNTTYWHKEEIISNGMKNLREGTKLNGSFSLNLSEIEMEIEAIQESLDFSGGKTHVEAITTVRYTGEVGSERVDVQKDFLLPIEIEDSTCKVSNGNYNETITRDVVHTVSVPQPPSMGDKIVSVSYISILIILILGLTLVKHRYKPLDASAIKELSRAHEYGKFKDLISKGKLPPDIENRDMVKLEVKSLTDLANIAIDKDERVIFDEDASLYFIMHGNLLYLYRT